MRAWIAALVTLVVLLLSACGFHLRGSYSLPFDTLYIALPDTTELHATIKRNIESMSQTRIIDDPKEAQAILTVLGDTQQKNILALSGRGQVREFQLVRTFKFRLHNAAGREFMPPSQIVIHREMTFDDSQLLAKQAEEVLIWQDIQVDLVQQLLRRLSAAKLKTAEAP